MRRTIYSKPKCPDIIGRQLWLDASAISDLHDGDAVTTWLDSSGNGQSVTQATAGKKPTFRRNGIGTRPAIEFDGTADILVRAGASPFNVSQGTFFIVARADTLPAGAVTLFSSADEASDTRSCVFDVVNAEPRIVQENADTNDVVKGSALTVATNYILSNQSTGTAFGQRINGATQSLTLVAGSNNGDWYAETSARDNFTVGGRKRLAEGQWWDGMIAEILLYDSTLSAADWSSVEDYLALKYGVVM